MSHPLLEGLDEEQLAAVTAPSGPLLVIAGAGSGKTRVLTRRVAYQIQQGVADPRRMFIATFTRAAAGEMRERIKALGGEGVNVATYHSLMFRLLRAYWRSRGMRDLVICKDGERKKILKGLLGPPSRDFPLSLNVDVDLGGVSGAIGFWKNSLIHPDDQEVLDTIDLADVQTDIGAAARAYPLYEAQLAAQGKLDFDDFLLKAYDVLVSDPAFLERSRRNWTAHFLDEGQDQNLAQWRLTQLLAPPVNEPNLTVVADQRQCLYRFRGATPELIERFTDLYPSAATRHITTNYRSTPQVVSVANTLIRDNGLPDQVASRPKGAVTRVVPFDDQITQATEIARLVLEAKDHGYQGGDVAVLIRTNAQSAHLENAFVSAGLPYWCQNGGFFDRMEVGDIMAYLRLACDPTDEVSLRRLINRPTRYLGNAFVDSVVKASRSDLITGLSITETAGNKRLSPKQRGAAHDLADLLNSLRPSRKIAPGMAIDKVIDWTGYLTWLAANEGSTGGDDSRQENLDALVEVATSYPTIEALVQFADASAKLQRDTGNATEICTVHRAKGREWPIVVVSNFYEDSIPHTRAVEDGNREDERRVAYVALTRARNALVIAVPGEDIKGELVDPSSFIEEAGLELDEIAGDNWWGDAFVTPETKATARAEIGDLEKALRA